MGSSTAKSTDRPIDQRKEEKASERKDLRTQRIFTSATYHLRFETQPRLAFVGVTQLGTKKAVVQSRAYAIHPYN
jgi:hypothetical protein